MRKIFVVPGLMLVALMFQGAGAATWSPSASFSMDAAARFVADPAHCAQLLGDEPHEDGLSPAFHDDLEAALDATDLPPERAIGQISVRCRQHLGQ